MTNPLRELTAAARQARRRWILAHGLRLGARAAPVSFAALALLLLLARQGGVANPGLGAAALSILLFFAALLLAGYWKRPSLFQALALWDRRCGRHEMAASALAFAEAESGSPVEHLHVALAAERLRKDLPHLARHWPLDVRWARLILPALFLLLLGYSPLGVPPRTPRIAPPRLSSEEMARLGDEVRRIAQDIPKTNSDRQTIPASEGANALRQELAATAKALAQGKPVDTKQTLAELDRQARQAETLASTLGSGSAGKLSREFLNALSRQADTAALAEALQAEKPENAARAAKEIATPLLDRKATLEVAHRLRHALEQSLAAATGQDKGNPVGQSLAEAHKRLAEGQREKAGETLAQLARQLEQAAQRRATAESLKQLAQQLRQAGQRRFSPAGNAKTPNSRPASAATSAQKSQTASPNKSSLLASLNKSLSPSAANPAVTSATPSQSKSGQSNSASNPSQPKTGQPNSGSAPSQSKTGQPNSANASSQSSSTPPSANSPSASAQASGAKPSAAPSNAANAGSPQSGQPQAASASNGVSPSAAKIPVPGSPSTSAAASSSPTAGSPNAAPPVPGCAACAAAGKAGGGNKPGAGQGAGGSSGQGAGTGSSPSASSAGGTGNTPGAAQGAGGLGGLAAGTGSAALAGTGDRTRLPASSTRVVQAKPSGDGPSILTEREGAPHPETSTVALERTAREFLKAQEESLDDPSLPLARREEIIRYFSTVRSAFNDE